MNDTISFRRDYVNEIRGFLNVFASRCKDCMKRNSAECDGCMCGRAVRLMRFIDTPKEVEIRSAFVQSPHVRAIADIIGAIRAAKRPILPKEIKIPGMSRQRLHMHLKRMCKEGYVVRIGTDIGSMYKIGYRKMTIPGVI